MDTNDTISRDLSEFNEAIRKNPDDADAYRGRGKAYFDLGLFNVAIDDFDRAIRRNPNIASFYIDRGNAYFEKHEFDRAIADYDDAVRIGTMPRPIRHARGPISTCVISIAPSPTLTRPSA